MRISDWSSDVCSSDLVCLQSHYDLPVTCCDFCIILRTHVHEQHPGCDQARLQPPIASRPLQGDLDIVNVTLPYIAMAVNISIKIGRASCRERVCQYVSISVVAVSLKKKNTYISSTTQVHYKSHQNQ